MKSSSAGRFVWMFALIIFLAGASCLAKDMAVNLTESHLKALIKSGDKIKDEISAQNAVLAFFRAGHPGIEQRASVHLYASAASLTRSSVSLNSKLERGDSVWTVDVLNAGASDLFPIPEGNYWVRAQDGAVFEIVPR